VQFLIYKVRTTELAPWYILRTSQKDSESEVAEASFDRWDLHSIKRATMITGIITLLR